MKGEAMTTLDSPLYVLSNTVLRAVRGDGLRRRHGRGESDHRALVLGLAQTDARYLGVQVVRYRAEEHHLGRLRRCHVVTSEPVGHSEWEPRHD